MSDHAVIAGIGTALPEGCLTADDFASLATRLCARIPREEALIRTVIRQSGVDKRHSVLVQHNADGRIHAPLFEDREKDTPRSPTTGERMQAYAKHAPPLAKEASIKALDNAGLEARDITHVVIVSCTGFYSPGLDFELINALGLRNNVSRRIVGFMGCHGALNGLQEAASICALQPDANVLLCSVELCTLHFQLEVGRNALLPNSLFADGAAALVVNNGQHDEKLLLVDCASHYIPGTTDLMTWDITNTGFRMTLDSSVPDVIRTSLLSPVEEFLLRNRLQRSDIANWLIHPGGPRVIDACGNALGLTSDQLEPSREMLRTHGNMSSCTVLHLLAGTTNHPSLVIAFGPGLVAEFALLVESAFNKLSEA